MKAFYGYRRLHASPAPPKIPSQWPLWCGILLFLLGGVVIFGRFAGILPLVVIVPNGSPMAFLTAVGFMLGGAGLVMHSLQRVRLGQFLGAALTVFGVVLFVYYAGRSYLGWFQSFRLTPNRPSTGVGFDGNMSLSTAVCLFAFGGMLVLLGTQRLFARTLLVIASVMAAIAALALVGYGTGVDTTSNWWRGTGMAIHSALGFILAGSAMIVWALQRLPMDRRRTMRSLPMFVAVTALVTVVAVAAWVTNRQQEAATNWLGHTGEVLALVDELQAEVNEMVTLRERPAETRIDLASALQLEFDAELARLAELTKGNSAQSPLIKELMRLGAAEFARLNEPVMPTTGSRIGGLRSRLARIASLELSLLDQRKQEARLAAQRTNNIILFGNGLAAGLGLLAVFFIRRADRARDKALTALRDSEERSRLMVEGVRDYAIYRLDEDGRVATWNAGAERNKGYRADEIIGQHFSLFYPNELRVEGVPARALKTAAETGVFEDEGWRVRKDGSRFWAHIVLTALRDAEGTLIGYTKVTRDISERRKIEQAYRASEQRFRTAFDNAGIGMALVDLDGRWLQVNHAICEITGYDAETLSRKTFQEITHPDDLAADLNLVQELLAGKRRNYKMEKRYFHRDGHIVWVRLTVSIIIDDDGKPVHFVSQIEDITERRNLIETIAQARDEALTASRHKSEFLANMSHEIRTPMNGVIGMTSILLDTQLTQDQRDIGRTIQQSAENLLTIINDVLDFSKIEAGKLGLELADFDLRLTVEDTLALFAASAHEKGIELLCDFDSRLNAGLRGDAGRIRQVLTNLVGNATKFTREGEVMLKVSLINQSAEACKVRFEVRDTGIGIPKVAQTQLFQPFVQVDGTTTRRYGGTGLGLAISRQLVGLMGGVIGLNSIEGAGSTFWFELALPKSDTFAPDYLPPVRGGLVVLVVDDNASCRRILSEQMIRFGAHVETASTGADAIAQLHIAAQRGTPYHAAIIDWGMPEMDGISLAVEVRADPILKTTPLVILSRIHDIADATVWTRIGFLAQLPKPVREVSLHGVLREIAQAKPVEPAPIPAERPPERTVSPDALRFLVVEDNRTNQIVARRLLEREGFVVDVAENGVEALRRLSVASYHVILMDCQMPEMDGYTATMHIRSGRVPQANPRVPIIALTAYALPGDREKCLAAGMDDYVTKPLRIQDLRIALQNCGVQAG